MEDITVQELKIRIDAGESLIIIDVREQYEYDDFNINGILVPLGVLPSMIDDWDDWHDKEVIVHCKSGGRSAAAKHFMMENGFKNVRNLLGGMMDWQAQLGA